MKPINVELEKPAAFAALALFFGNWSFNHLENAFKKWPEDSSETLDAIINGVASAALFFCTKVSYDFFYDATSEKNRIFQHIAIGGMTTFYCLRAGFDIRNREFAEFKRNGLKTMTWTAFLIYSTYLNLLSSTFFQK